MIITSTGNVGIGTASPSQKLTVFGGVQANNYYYPGGASTAYRYTSGADVSNTQFTTLFNVTTDRLSGAVRVSFMGTTGSAVVSSVVDIVRNHSKDIYVESKSGIYTLLTLRIITSDAAPGLTGDFMVQAKTNATTSMFLTMEVFPLNSESVTFTSTPINDVQEELIHTCWPGSYISGTGNNPDIDGALAISGYMGVGVTSSVPQSRLHVNGSMIMASGLSNSSTRPLVSAGTPGYGEIRGYSSTLGVGADDGFLRVSAGGGASASTKSYIDISGWSSTYDMNNNVVIGTRGLERMRVDRDGNVSVGVVQDESPFVNTYAKLLVMGTNSVVYSSTASYGLSDNTNHGLVSTIYNLSMATGSYAGIKLITRFSGAKKWGMYNVSKGYISADLTFGHGDGDAIGSEVMRLTDESNVAIGLTAPSARLNVRADRGITGSTVFKVDGNVGELFTVTDSLTGSLMSVNDISGLPILEVFDDNTILMGDYQAPSLYSTTKSVVATVTNYVVYQLEASLYTSVFFEYNVQNSTNLRAGTIMAVWSSGAIQFMETSTMDIGNTSPISFDVVLTTISGVVYVQFRTTTSTSGWTIKSIIRSI